MHTVADLMCASCGSPLGWMYIRAPNGEQRYKEGELVWLDLGEGSRGDGEKGIRRANRQTILRRAALTRAGRYILEAAKIVKENNW